jgi:adenylyltransferase/sulfurtransferase
MTANDDTVNRIRVVMPSVASFDMDYKDETDLKKKICQRLDIEPEFTNLIFVDRAGDMTPVNVGNLDDIPGDDTDGKPRREVIVDYIWARQMIVLGDKQRDLREAKALVVGAGALGNEIVKNLAWIGFGTITIIDYDSVEFSNVSRGLFEKEDIGRNKADVLAGRLGKNSPYARIQSIPGRVEECREQELSGDVILSALDNMPTRIWLASLCVKRQIPLIDGGIKEFRGRVQTYYPGGPCLACNIPLDRYAEIMELKNPCEGYEEGAVASFSTVASIVAGIQANEAMKVVTGLMQLSGVLLMDFLKNNYILQPLRRNNACFVCGREEPKEISFKS